MKSIKFAIFAVLFSLALTSCTSNSDFEKGSKILESQGYSNVQNTGHSYFCCDEKDTYSTGFTAVGKDGTIVKGCFCSNLLKGITVRYE